MQNRDRRWWWPARPRSRLALSKLGLSVTVLERGDWLLRRQLDARAAQLLQSYLEGLGMTILLNAWATRLEWIKAA